jgi:CelD/BcsL family acetyltransferase involved in cellulose biosynthesis
VRAANPFATPDWHEAWLATHPQDRPVVVAVRRDDGSLAGVVALVERKEGRTSRLTIAGEAIADWFSPACAPEDEAGVAVATAEVADRLVGRGTWRLDRCVRGGAWAEAFSGALPRGWSALHSPREDVLGIVLLQAGEALSSKARREARRLRRKLEQDRAGRIRMSEGPEEAARDMDALLALHAARWGDDGFDPAETEFQRRFARSAAERGWLRLWVAEADGVMAGALCNWCVGASTFSYIQSFNPEYARYGIGTMLHEDATALAREEGCAEYNILRGEEGFKQKFPAQPRELESYVVVRARSAAGLASRGALGAQAAWRLLPEAPRAQARRLLRRG